MTPSIYTLIAGTAAQLATATFSSVPTDLNYLPADVFLFEKDTKRLKRSNGTTTTYAALPYVIEEQFTPEMKAIVNGANAANGALVLDGDALVGKGFIPDSISSKYQVVLDIAARDALAASNRNGIVLVKDASADTTVTASSATYVWDADNLVWLKIGEYESMDVDFSDFVMDGDSIERLTDGTEFVRFLATERTQLATLISTLSALTGSWTTKVSEITSRFDAIEVRQDAVDARLVALETTVSDQDNHILRDTDVIEFNGYTVSRWSA